MKKAEAEDRRRPAQGIEASGKRVYLHDHAGLHLEAFWRLRHVRHGHSRHVVVLIIAISVLGLAPHLVEDSWLEVGELLVSRCVR